MSLRDRIGQLLSFPEVVASAGAAVLLVAAVVDLLVTNLGLWSGPRWVALAGALSGAGVALLWIEVAVADDEPPPRLLPVTRTVRVVAFLLLVILVAPDLTDPTQLGALQISIGAGAVVVLALARPIGVGSLMVRSRLLRTRSGRTHRWGWVDGRLGRVRAWMARVGLSGRRVDIALAVLLAIGTSLVMFWFIREPILSDDTSYFKVAGRLFDGDLSVGVANRHRLGLIGSVAVARGLFGASATAYYAVPFAYGVGLVVGMFAFGRLFFSCPVAFLGAALLALNPTFLSSATLLLPDWPAMFWFMTGATAAVLAVRAGERSAVKRRRLAVVTGACFFMALWTKEAMIPLIIAAIAIPFAVERSGRWLRDMGIAVGTLALLLVGELTLTARLFGDAFGRFRSIADGHLSGAAGGWDKLGGDPQTWRGLAGRYFEMLADTEFGTFLLASVLVGVFVFAARRTAGTRILLIWIFVGWAFISLFVVGFSPPSPLLRTKLRYLSMVVTFVPLFTVASISICWQIARSSTARSPRRALVASAVALLTAFVVMATVAGLAFMSDRPFLARNGSTVLATTGSAVSEATEAAATPTGLVYVDHRTLRGVGFWMDQDLDLTFKSLDGNSLRHGFDTRSAEVFQPGDIVILNYSAIRSNAAQYYPDPLPEWVDDLPESFVVYGEDSRGQNIVVYLVTES